MNHLPIGLCMGLRIPAHCFDKACLSQPALCRCRATLTDICMPGLQGSMPPGLQALTSSGMMPPGFGGMPEGMMAMSGAASSASCTVSLSRPLKSRNTEPSVSCTVQ